MGDDRNRNRNHWLALVLVLGVASCGVVLARFGPAGFDPPLLLWFRDSADTGRIAGPAWLTEFWLALTRLGDTGPRLLVASLLLLALLRWRRWQSALFSAGILLSGILLSELLKVVVGRARPQLVTPLDAVGSLSFPSGHALNSSLFYLTVALLLAPVLKQRGARWALYAVAVGLTLATGVSRIALGVHWPSDVLASWILAAAWLWFWFALAHRFWPKALVLSR
ncbi:MAG: hypothetical protein COS34_08710 [Lysobacterales bacterium CG02_land_8_20_14_3_00_62_12]|nr:MAG: hypothetical protein COS34_08710 [Xanthomonadales bacterium CG02_land_8_20_14_3_00_62_12]